MAHSAEDLHAHPHVLLAGHALQTEADGTPRLIGTLCRDCGAKVFPPAPVCPECMSENVADTELATEGTLYSWSVVHVAPRSWHVPYVAGYVDLPDGVRVFAHIVEADPDMLTMDMPVRLTTAILGDDDGVPVESYAFTPKSS